MEYCKPHQQKTCKRCHLCRHNKISIKWFIKTVLSNQWPSHLWTPTKTRFNIIRLRFCYNILFKVKGLWDELNLYSLILPCPYESNQTLEAYKERNSTMQLLMGLTETYTIVYGNILMMTSIPMMGKVFSMIMQEGR